MDEYFTPINLYSTQILSCILYSSIIAIVLALQNTIFLRFFSLPFQIFFAKLIKIQKLQFFHYHWLPDLSKTSTPIKLLNSILKNSIKYSSTKYRVSKFLLWFFPNLFSRISLSNIPKHPILIPSKTAKLSPTLNKLHNIFLKLAY